MRVPHVVGKEESRAISICPFCPASCLGPYKIGAASCETQFAALASHHLRESSSSSLPSSPFPSLSSPNSLVPIHKRWLRPTLLVLLMRPTQGFETPLQRPLGEHGPPTPPPAAMGWSPPSVCARRPHTPAPSSAGSTGLKNMDQFLSGNFVSQHHITFLCAFLTMPGQAFGKAEPDPRSKGGRLSGGIVGLGWLKFRSNSGLHLRPSGDSPGGNLETANSLLHQRPTHPSS